MGGVKSIPVDCRIVAASNVSLKELMLNGVFREDLYYRLNVVNIRVPPLRERKEDIVPLALRFMARFSEHYEKPLPRLS